MAWVEVHRQLDDNRCWSAALSLEFDHEHGKTLLRRREHRGPLCVQKPFYPGDGACHVYLLHPPGGLAGGDRLEVAVTASRDANALITTPAATKFYRSTRDRSVLRQSLHIAAGASVEWLPLESILFGESRAEIATEVFLSAGASFIGWETLVLGRPLSGDRYANGELDQQTDIYIDSQPIVRERLRWSSGDRLLSAPYGLAGHNVIGALYAHPATQASLSSARHILTCAGVCGGATLIGELLIVRVLAVAPERVKQLMADTWMAIRRAVIGLAPCSPRIWTT